MNELNVILNGKAVKGNKNETILSLAKRHGYNIPTLCNDHRLEPYSSCYICVVEIEGMRGLQPACSTKIAEGMKIETNNGKVFKARKTALDLLLSNHYADCTGPCKQTCPAGVDVQGYISYIDKGMYNEAVELIKETNPFPAVCGRVCVRPCEVACRRNLLDEGNPVGIDYMKRFAADWDLDSATKFIPNLKPATGKRVAIVGSGPAGLSAAFFLQKEGHQCDVYEAAPKAGGWLRYGIPEYRLPNYLLQREIDNITELGAKIFYNQKLGKNLTYKALKFKYDSVILAIGCQKATSIGCEGDDAPNVLLGIDFLKKMELTNEHFNFKGKKIAVIGGGNTAMDCCRSARRCGSENVSVIYRRTENEMPANPIEIHESKLEGVEYNFLTAPVKVNKNAEGQAISITCIKMGLGEPDASGRRRPVPIEGSEFEIEVDYILAAIGQKTVIEFVNEVNRSTDIGELKLTKWGDIDANPTTLQTGVKYIFAAGDGVTGAATLIQAIGQAKIAARSCHQFLSGIPMEPEHKEFISKRDNFKVQVKADYLNKYEKLHREEMPTLNPLNRKNFNEVELGYENETIVKNEAQRCMECGCVAYYDCDLKRYSTTYEADQKHYTGAFIKKEVDFRHPFIEIDNNKCILCSRCVRICSEVVGAKALGLVDRGFITYLAPAMDEALQDTTCESCGLCLSACPTAALSENLAFKPGPVKLNEADTICNYCSVGCSITLHHKKNFVMKVTGKKGTVNTDGNLCKYAKFGYQYLNDKNRITKPLLKENGTFKEISFAEAYDMLTYKIKSVKPNENAFYAGARLSNEEMYLVQKLARIGAKTNNITSFHYINRGGGYFGNAIANASFADLYNASKIYLIGSEINDDNAVAGFFVNNAQHLKSIPMTVVTNHKHSSVEHKADEVIRIKSYFDFVKALNHYILSNGLQNQLFVNDCTKGFEEYKKNLLSENYAELVKRAGITKEAIEQFAQEYNNQLNAIIVFSEKELSSHTTSEIKNLALITGKLGKTANGIISLKEKNNSQGLFDMGVCSRIGVGGVSILDEGYQAKLKAKWGISEFPQLIIENQKELLEDKKLKNIFIFGEDPIGCAIDSNEVSAWFKSLDFIMVQDYFLTETAKQANLILPASFPIETGGSFTNTQKIIQKFEHVFELKMERSAIEQLLDIIAKFGYKGLSDVTDVMMEAISLLPDNDVERFEFTSTQNDNQNRIFNFGCDNLVKYTDDYFDIAFKK